MAYTDVSDASGVAGEPLRAPGDPAKNDKDTLEEAKEAFQLASDACDENNREAEADLRFARLSEQWPAAIREQREREGRPCLTIPRMNAFIRQVVNDARLNKPSIKVHPVDSGADPETADVYNGLIRNIEATSNADVAYDTAAESAVAGGFGYFRIGLDYSHDDTFDMDINIQRCSNPFLIYPDPYSTEADSSDWNSAFVVERLPKDIFETEYKQAEEGAVDWSADYTDLHAPWFEDECVLVAEWWTRKEVERKIVKLSTGEIVSTEWLEGFDQLDDFTQVPRIQALAMQGIQPVAERMAKSWKTHQCILTGAEVLERNPWPGRYIPIVPVYGDEVTVEGRRYFRSLIRDAKDSQQMLNFWRTNATELVALAPRVPFIGPKGAFKTDAIKWGSANRTSHAYMEYDGSVPPQRQPLDMGSAAGSLQEALNASDDMKSIIGLYDASLGAKSNETSGKAIIARQREGDVSTFHFQDNLTRAIRHGGRIILDLIPHVYSEARIIRVLGEDGTPKAVPVNQPTPVMEKPDNGQPGAEEEPVMGPDGQPQMRIYSLTAGKYDLTVTAGPSFTTRREEAASQMMELMRLFPQAAPFIGDLVAKNLDWPGADEIAERLQKMLPPQIQGPPPEIMQAMQEGQQQIEELGQENMALKQANEAAKLQIQGVKQDQQIAAAKLRIDAAAQETKQFQADTDRLQVVAPAMTPEQIVELVQQTIADIFREQAA